MYLDLLRGVLDDWGDGLSGPALVAYAVACRTEMLAAGPRRGGDAHVALAAEVAYDRALVKLCAERCIDVDLAEFSYPIRARSHLEAELAARGVHLSAPTPSQERLEV